MRASVIDNARKLGLELKVVRLPGAASPTEAAAVIGCDDARMTAVSVFVADGDPVVCIACGTRPVDVGLLADVLDVAELRAASASEVRAATGCPIGGVPPFGHGLPVVLERSLLDHATVWTTAGDGSTVVEVETARLADCTSATVATVSG
jgi:prolyl-tRNA editing enzyme YbaK/EbsC (Cys-tRNA(Pro) deacylase)